MQMVSIIKERDSILKSAFLKNEGQVLSTRTSLTVREESLRAKLFSPDFSSSQRNARKATLWQQEKKRRKLQSLWWLGTSERTKASSTKAPQNFVKWHGIGKSSLMIGHSFLFPSFVSLINLHFCVHFRDNIKPIIEVVGGKSSHDS